MRRELHRHALAASEPVAPPNVPAGLWEALQRSAITRNRAVGRALAAFPNGAQDLAVDEGQGTLRNKHDLLCPRSGCGSVILKSGIAALVERMSMVLEPPEHTAATLLPPLPVPPGTMNWWFITPNAMAFENIGFSKGVISEGTLSTGKRLKLLSCADCDLGPLGWCEEGGSEFWLACSRVSYRE
ncbi:Mss4-like protein [Daedalea quercina L-15889]|uniref:Mss4-like protein n=1 Tax=Daedalea quercina L-15889 TaxID=1314783 RepID=A0A165RDL8_9APHY|nr:Mss4-like protein [Daedalea quercina L-15889]